MSLPLDIESKSIIENTLRRFVAESYEPTVRHQRLKQRGVDCLLHWSLLAELGVLGLPFDEALGGLGAANVDVADALAVLARGLIFEPFVEAAIISGTVLAASQDAQKRHRTIAEVIDGSSVTVTLGGRPNGSGKLTYRNVDGGYRVSGTSCVVPFAEQADFWLLAAIAGDGAPIVLRVPRHEISASVVGYRLMDGRPAADVTFHEAIIPSSSVWIEGDAASQALSLASLRAVSAYCADVVGVMALLVEVTGEYLRTRVQFGVAIGTFQALQHRFADMHMRLVESQAISREFARSLDEGTPEEQAWLRFAAASVVERAARMIGHEAIQMHGGMGVTDELIVSHCNARLVVLTRLMHAWVDEEVPLCA